MFTVWFLIEAVLQYMDFIILGQYHTGSNYRVVVSRQYVVGHEIF